MKYKYIATISLLFSFSSMAQNLMLSSNSVRDGGTLEAKFFANSFGCDGQNMMPDFSFKNIPAGTKSFALTYFDKDAPIDGGFVHFVIYDIPAGTVHLNGGVNGGVLPATSIVGVNDTGSTGFIGSCPQIGEIHHYQWRLTALDIDKLPIDANATPAITSLNILGHKLETTTLTVTAKQNKKD